MGVQVRQLEPAEIAVAVDWAAREGWNPGLADAPAFHASDPGGFLGLFLDGALAATVSIVRYGSAFAFLGFYIVRPTLRGRGHGVALWRSSGLARPLSASMAFWRSSRTKRARASSRRIAPFASAGSRRVPARRRTRQAAARRSASSVAAM